MSKMKKKVGIWWSMKPSSLRRLAFAVFLVFSVLGPLEILMESHMKVLSWGFIIIQTVISGSFAASIILTIKRKILFFSSIIFWSLLLVLNARGLFFTFNESGLEMHIERNLQQPIDSPARPLNLSADEVSSIYTQRTMVGVLAIMLLSAGYAAFIYVIRQEIGQRMRLETEVKIAQEIQTSLLPSPNLSTGWCDASGVMNPAAEVAGDYFDMIQVSEYQVAIVVADVTGHGVGAGILSSMTKSALRLQLQHDPSPAMVLKNLNTTLFDLSNEKTFVTCAYGLFDHRAKTVSLSTAGHPPILRHEKSSNTLKQIRTSNPGLGMRREGEFAETQIPLQSGDSYLFYTDGVTEAMNAKNDQFGGAKLEQIVAQDFTSAQTLCDRIQSELTAFTGSKSFQDDVTVVGVRIS
ncbi:MAG: PP2C family protein-serine/threonine phosphatase [Bacteroidota bacterium]